MDGTCSSNFVKRVNKMSYMYIVHSYASYTIIQSKTDSNVSCKSITILTKEQVGHFVS